MKASGVKEEYTTLDCLVEEALVLEKDATKSKESSKEWEIKKQENLEWGKVQADERCMY